MSRDRIVIAGATGFVGGALTERLARRAQRPHIVGLSRGRQAQGAWDELVACDLFSLKDVEAALAGARYAVYLVHSMLPSARLVQAGFADLDLICADNFGRAAHRAGVEQIVYLGGLVPDVSELSAHLESRREVEHALAAQGVPTTTLRAGMVIGPGGSSFELLSRLVKRLPAMITPRWTANLCQPIDLGTTVALLDHAIGRPACAGQVFDIGGPDVLCYRDMMQIMSETLGLRRPMLPVPFVSPRTSRLWVSLITGAPRALVKPLIESLRHDMVCRDRRLQDAAELPGLPFRDAVSWCLAADAAGTMPADRRAAGKRGADSSASRSPEHSLAGAVTAAVAESIRTPDHAPHAYQAAPRVRVAGVRSVQRIPLPPGRDAEWAAHEYMRWLPKGAWPLLHVEVDHERTATFALSLTRTPLLVLDFSPERSTPGRQLFYVKEGLLARKTDRGRLEMRVTPDGEHLLTAIHEFHPRLPWLLYRFSQALVHRWIMTRFGKHLGRVAARAS